MEVQIPEHLSIQSREMPAELLEPDRIKNTVERGVLVRSVWSSGELLHPAIPPAKGSDADSYSNRAEPRAQVRDRCTICAQILDECLLRCVLGILRTREAREAEPVDTVPVLTDDVRSVTIRRTVWAMGRMHFVCVVVAAMGFRYRLLCMDFLDLWSSLSGTCHV
jgi:hypothetical protein